MQIIPILPQLRGVDQIQDFAEFLRIGFAVCALKKIYNRSDGDIETSGGVARQCGAKINHIKQFLGSAVQATVLVESGQRRDGIETVKDPDLPPDFLESSANGFLPESSGRRQDGHVHKRSHEYPLLGSLNQAGRGHGRKHPDERSQGRTSCENGQ
jgi:hypothetical protein